MPYATPPALRIAYDLEGAQLLYQNPTTLVWLDAHSRSVKALNDERGGGADFGGPDSDYVLTAALILPTAYRIQAFLAEGGYKFVTPNTSNKMIVGVEFSSDSTNGIDGNFTQVQAYSSVDGTIELEYRNGYSTETGLSGSGFGLPLNDDYRRLNPGGTTGRGYQLVSGTHTRNVTVIRLRMQVYNVPGSSRPSPTMHLHLYGSPDTSATQTQLKFWKPSIDAEVSPGELDWGDVPQSSSADKSFRIKNYSETEEATGITVRAEEGASTTTPSPAGMYLFSIDSGATWLTSVSIAALSPEAVSAEILFRRVVPLNATLSNWAPRLTAEVGEWI